MPVGTETPVDSAETAARHRAQGLLLPEERRTYKPARSALAARRVGLAGWADGVVTALPIWAWNQAAMVATVDVAGMAETG
jgi:hypothetical protein